MIFSITASQTHLNILIFTLHKHLHLHLHSCIWQIHLSKVTYNAFKLYISKVHAFPGNRTHEPAVASACWAPGRCVLEDSGAAWSFAWFLDLQLVLWERVCVSSSAASGMLWDFTGTDDTHVLELWNHSTIQHSCCSSSSFNSAAVVRSDHHWSFNTNTSQSLNVFIHIHNARVAFLHPENHWCVSFYCCQVIEMFN